MTNLSLTETQENKTKNMYTEEKLFPVMSEKVKNSSPKKLSADCRLPPFTKIFCQQSANWWPFVG